MSLSSSPSLSIACLLSPNALFLAAIYSIIHCHKFIRLTLDWKSWWHTHRTITHRATYKKVRTSGKEMVEKVLRATTSCYELRYIFIFCAVLHRIYVLTSTKVSLIVSFVISFVFFFCSASLSLYFLSSQIFQYIPAEKEFHERTYLFCFCFFRWKFLRTIYNKTERHPSFILLNADLIGKMCIFLIDQT